MSGISSGMNSHRVTEIDVGEPPFAPDGWDTFKLNFHGFESLSTRKEVMHETSKFRSLGHDWYVGIYPGGHNRANEGMVSIFLYSTAKDVSINYKVCIRDLDGEEFVTMSGSDSNFVEGWGWDNFVERSKIVDTSNNILDNGTLIVEVQLMFTKKSTLPRRIYVPKNPFFDKIQGLYNQDGKCSDVKFIFAQENPGKSNDKEEGNEDRTSEAEDKKDNKVKEENKNRGEYYAHRVVLQACAPGLFELCEPYDNSTPVPLSNIKSEIFGLLLKYVYGFSISVANWKEHSKELIDAADLYGVSNLKLEAESWYVKCTDITSENVIDLLLYADAKNCALLKESVMDYFVANGKDSLERLSFDEIPDSRSLFTDLLLSMSVRGNDTSAKVNKKDGATEDSCKFRSMRVCGLRRELDKRGLDVDGSREVLVKRLRKEPP